MQKLLREYLDELNRKQKRRRKTVIAVVLAAIMLVSGVIWNLTQYGIAMTDEPKCGMEEHTHSDSCYTNVLVCGQEESAGHTHTETCYQTTSELVCGQEESEEHTHDDSCYQTVSELVCGQEESAGHTHTEACYEKQLVCGKEEHTHSEACYIDTTADVEDASVWNAQYADTKWKDAWGEDLVIAAKKQIGYKESTDNYTVATDGSHKGYTRYGQFAGDVYADWDAVFVNFCMHYAGLEKTGLFPKETETAKWHEKFAKGNAGQNAAYLTDAKDYEPQIGDILFFEKEKEETDDQMGIISSYDKEKNEIKVIEGNSDNAVKENKYAADDKHITAYLKISELETAYKNDGAEAGEEETPEEEAPVAEELNYEDEQITVKVTTSEIGIIPEGASLKVVPITKENAETEAQYQNVEAKLQEKAENEEYDIAGFLAYDISFVDADGNKLEPNGKVNVSMDYKSPELPQEVVENGAADAEVTVLHLEEDENGEVQQIVDMGAEQKATVDTLATTEGEKVQSVEVETESFSVFVLTWKGINGNLNINLIDEAGNDICPDDLRYEISQETTVQKIADQIASQLPGYTFKRAVRAENSSSAIIESTEITKLQYNNASKKKRWEGYNGTEWKKINNDDDKLFFIYEATDPGTGGGDGGGSDGGGGEGKGEQLGTPEHYKKIKKNDDGDYTLSLDVIGKVGEATPIDILLIIDKSGSMDSTRRTNVNTAVTTLISTLKIENKENIDINLAAVTFSSDKDLKGKDSADSSQNTDGDAWRAKSWTSLTGITTSGPTDNSFFTLDDSSGGTNWQAGVRMGENVLKGRASKKYVVFLTDGDPTFRIGSVTNSATLKGTTLGTGSSDPQSKNYNAAVNEWKNSSNLYAAKKYIIDANPTGDNQCDELAAAVGGKELAGNNTTSMESAFKEIANNILKPAYKNVVISDTLSDYTEFAFDRFTEHIVDGKTYHPEIKVYSTSTGNTKTQLQEYVDYTVTKMDWDTKTVEVSILNGGKLEDNTKYSVEFNVIPSKQAATDFLRDGQYNAKGDANTDAPDNDTSSEKDGFYSNENAVLKYSENDSPQTNAPYDKPVIQIDTIQRLVSKQWKGNPTDSVTMKLTAKVTIDGQESVVDYITLSDAQLEASNEWKHTWQNLPKYYYYIDAATHQDKRVEIQYVITEDPVDGYDANIPSEEEQNRNQSEGKETVIINSKKAYWQIRKESSSTDENGNHPLLEGAEFVLKDSTTEEEKYSGISGSDGIINWKDVSGNDITPQEIEAGTYLLQETKAPNGYAVSSEKWTLEFTSKGSMPNITSSSGKEIKKSEVETDGVTTYSYIFENTPVYSLPSTGGSGIYWYIFGGILLMAGAMLIIYKNKCKEVLRS